MLLTADAKTPEWKTQAAASQTPPATDNHQPWTMLSILRKARMKDKEMRVLMLGLDNAGKTTIVKSIMNEDVNSVSPTLGFIIKTIDYDGYKLNIWDVGGQKTLRTYWKNYFERTDTLIWVVDACDRNRMDDCQRELKGLLLEERLMGASLLVLSNKSDVNGSLNEDEVREELGLDDIKTHQWKIMACSAITGHNLQQGLRWVIQDAKDRLFLF
ncbi:ADP-ribosylation factor [Aulographum hederae CBS 113979]|uniref:Abnormal eversion of vulva protein 20 n=1 Tax=Aulographum hederae CBS 113979 TaxID=1176131 RepID=A0A6G1GWT8_9PEZI|nr:ADP-ribosylation factor [Aulographum hederae CBS 113979]